MSYKIVSVLRTQKKGDLRVKVKLDNRYKVVKCGYQITPTEYISQIIMDDSEISCSVSNSDTKEVKKFPIPTRF